MSMTTMNSGRPARGAAPPSSMIRANAHAARNSCFATGSVGQPAGTDSANSASISATRRALSFTPVSGSNRPCKHHMPSASVHRRSRTAAFCRSNFAMPSSRWMDRASCSSRLRKSPTDAAAASPTSPSARRISSARCCPSSPFAAFVTASTWPGVTDPSFNAPASAGVAPNVPDRSSTRPASPCDPRPASAMACSGNDAHPANAAANCASAAASHDLTAATDRNPPCSSARDAEPAPAAARTDATPRTRSHTAPTSMRTTVLKGCDRVPQTRGRPKKDSGDPGSHQHGPVEHQFHGPSSDRREEREPTAASRGSTGCYAPAGR